MEKYSRWSDLTTGINPFVPQQARLHKNVGVKALQLLGGTALVLLRAPLVLVVGAVLVVTNIVTSVLAVVPFVGRLLKRLTEWLLCSLLLVILGVFVSEEDANARRLGLVYVSLSLARACSCSSRTNKRLTDVMTLHMPIVYQAQRRKRRAPLAQRT